MESTLGFPNTPETIHVVTQSCIAIDRPEGLASASEFCPLFLPAFRKALEELRNGVSPPTPPTPPTPIPPANLKCPLPLPDPLPINNTQNNEGETKHNQTSAAAVAEETTKQLQLDNNGCIPNPKPKRNNQLTFGDILQLTQVEQDAWKKNLQLKSAWSSVNPSLFNLRGKKYLSNRKKNPSNFAIYDPIGVDILSTDRRWFCSSNTFWTPNIPPEQEINGMPSRLTIEITFPTFDAENAMWGKQVPDGPSHVWLITCVLSAAAKRQLLGHEPLTEGVAFAREFMQQDDPFHGRFKTIFQLANVEDAKVSAALGFTGRTLLKNYNGKPYLSNNSHRVRRSSGHVYICQDVHTFGYLARSNYPTQAKNLQHAVVHLGWTVEGRSEAQLPEQLLAGLTLIRMDPTPKLQQNIDVVLAENNVESGVDSFSITPSEWLRRNLHLKH